MHHLTDEHCSAGRGEGAGTRHRGRAQVRGRQAQQALPLSATGKCPIIHGKLENDDISHLFEIIFRIKLPLLFQVINATINKGPANNTEACLQHEITRLTGENFDLREKIENLASTPPTVFTTGQLG